MLPEPEDAHLRCVGALHALIGFLDALVQPVAFEAGADHHDHKGHDEFHAVGVLQRRVAVDGDDLLHGFGCGEETADEEQQRRHDERREVFGAVPAEGVLRIEFVLGDFVSDDEHDLVRTVGDGVHGFGKHR